MAALTREAIKNAFIELLDERPMSRITVKDVVLRCGINRNTFYYYFADLPALAQAVVAEGFIEALSESIELHSIEDCLEHTLVLALEHRQAIMNLYRSTDREQFELIQWRICEQIVSQFLDDYLKERRVMPEDRQFLQDYVRAALFGIAMDWLHRGLNPEITEEIHRMCQLKQGHLEEVLSRCEEAFRE